MTQSEARRRATHRFLSAMLAGTVVAVSSAGSNATVLLDENFNDNAATYTKIVAGEATTASINIRLANNVVNTATDTGFDGFFGANPNRFLVLGNNAGDIVGEPNGQPSGARAMARFDLGLFGAGQHSLLVGFDYAFDTNQNPGPRGTTRSQDDFAVVLLDGSDNLLGELLRFDDVLRNEASRKGSFGQTVDFAIAAASNVRLAFDLIEYDGTGSSAAGVDNILVQAVPEPGSLALVGMGLAALARRGRGKA